MLVEGYRSRMASITAMIRAVEGFAPDPAPRAITSHRRTVTLLRTAAHPLDRQAFDPGHCTASAVVLSSDGAHVALVWHARLARWLQPGGHFEAGDASALAAARREALEELGIPLPAGPAPLVGVDVHEIPAARGEPAHWHHDLVFGFQLSGDGMLGGGDARAVWCAVADLAARGADEPLRRAVARARLALAPG